MQLPFSRLKLFLVCHLFLLLGIGMLLVCAVMMASTRHMAVRGEIAKADILQAAIERHISDNGWAPESAGRRTRFLQKLNARSSLKCHILIEKSGDIRFQKSFPNENLGQLPLSIARTALLSGSREIDYFGTTWGVYFRQRQYILISAPLTDKGEIVGAVTFSSSLVPIYQQLRALQKFILFYICFNGLILTSIGVFRISRKLITPLYHLLERADAAKGDDPAFYINGGSPDEFNLLSKSLNRMLTRLADGKKELRYTVSSLKKANSELKQAQQDMISAEKLASVGRLAAGIAHEIGNPIAIMKGYLELLKTPEQPPEQQRDFIDRTETELERVNIIIQQLLDLSRPNIDQTQETDIHNLLKDTVSVFSHQPLTSNLEILLELTASRHFCILNEGQLRQVFLNLIINASDAVGHKKKGRLVIRTENQRDENNEMSWDFLLISFIDNGHGISNDQLSSIFDPFFTTKAPGKGTGLGLSVSYMIAEAAGGRLSALQRPEGGACMQILLPLSETSPLHREPSYFLEETRGETI